MTLVALFILSKAWKPITWSQSDTTFYTLKVKLNPSLHCDNRCLVFHMNIMFHTWLKSYCVTKFQRILCWDFIGFIAMLHWLRFTRSPWWNFTRHLYCSQPIPDLKRLLLLLLLLLKRWKLYETKNYGHIIMFYKKGYWLKIRMEFLQLMEPPTMLLVPICRDMQLWWDKPPIPSSKNRMPGDTCFDDVSRICACVTWTQMYVTLQTKKCFPFKNSHYSFFNQPLC